jgi:hypothetical protein
MDKSWHGSPVQIPGHAVRRLLLPGKNLEYLSLGGESLAEGGRKVKTERSPLSSAGMEWAARCARVQG